MSETRVIPESLDVHVLHELCTGSIAARRGILRAVPGREMNAGGVDIHLVVDGGKGLMNFRVMVPAHEVDAVLDMIAVAKVES